MNNTDIIKILFCYLLASIAGYCAHRFNLPLPWMLGPLIVTALFNLFIHPIDIPVRTRPLGQMIIAAQVGLYFTADAASAIYSHGLAIIGIALITILLSILFSCLLRKITGTDSVSAFLASIPGGPVEMGNLAIRYGVEPGPVIFSQTLRISTIVIIIPFVLYYLIDNSTNDALIENIETNPIGMATLSLGAIITSALFYKLRINSPFFLGALSFSCLATSSGMVPVSAYPQEVMAFAQILLGTWLGSTFRKELFFNTGKMLVAICFTSSLLVFFSTLTALLMAHIADINWRALVLGAAPGSVTEMALTAKFLNEDVALITAFHLVRIFMILPNIPWMLMIIHKRSKQVEEFRS